MDPVVIGVEQVDESLYNTAVPSGPLPANQYSPSAFSRLSTFNMPHAVELSADSTRACTFRFMYSNEESPERDARLVAPNVQVLLGKKSKKILLIQLSSAIDQLEQRLPLFHASAASKWADEVPWHARFACQRNAEVIESLMQAMPDSIRDRIVDSLRTLPVER